MCGTRGGEAEQGAVDRVQGGGCDADAAQAEREHRVLAVARAMVRGAVGAEHREVGDATEPVVERREQGGDRGVVRPRVLEPALADLAVGAAVDPALLAVARPGARASARARRCG